jgi:predicted RNase H-like HicB family nuclease
MTTIEAIIERASDGTFTVYCKDEIFSGAGETMSAAKADMERQMAFYRQTAREEGFKYPAFLDDAYEIQYSFDATSLMKYYVGAGIFSLAGMEKVMGINQKQLWAYLNGTKPRKPQRDRIERGFRKLSRDLSTIFA